MSETKDEPPAEDVAPSEGSAPPPADGPPGLPEPASGAEPDAAVEVLLRRFLSLPPIPITLHPGPDAPDVDRTASTKPPSNPPSPKLLESFDAKLAEVEPLLAEARWDGIVDVLSRRETLPPPLALLYAIALKERDAQGAEGVAIRAVAALLCVPEESETALVIAKRLLRKNPVAWQVRRAPSARVSIAIVLVVAILGALVGLLVGPGVPLFR